MASGDIPRRIGVIALASAPPVLMVGVSPGFVSRHPTLAVALVLTYEVTLAALSFFGKAVRELENRYLPGFTDFLDRGLRYWFSGYSHRYREFVLRSQRFIDHKGLPTTGFYTPELDEVFIDVSLAMRAPSQVPTDLLPHVPSSVADRRSIRDFLDRRDPQLLAIVGGPGTGKTTLLRHAARAVCRQPGWRIRKVPILLFLRDHARTIAADPSVTLPDLIHQTLDRQAPVPRHDWFSVKLRRGRCVVFLDGLDEIAKQDDRRLIADWVEKLTTIHSKNHFVITSRPGGYRETPIFGATVLQVRALTDDQVNRFVINWYRAVESSALRDTGEDPELIADPKADDLLQRLRRATNLYDLTINPLLLTMIANVHRYRGALPGSRTDLYGEICQVMLWRRQEAKKLPIDMNGEKKEAIPSTPRLHHDATSRTPPIPHRIDSRTLDALTTDCPHDPGR